MDRLEDDEDLKSWMNHYLLSPLLYRGNTSDIWDRHCMVDQLDW